MSKNIKYSKLRLELDSFIFAASGKYSVVYGKRDVQKSLKDKHFWMTYKSNFDSNFSEFCSKITFNWDLDHLKNKKYSKTHLNHKISI